MTTKAIILEHNIATNVFMEEPTRKDRSLVDLVLANESAIAALQAAVVVLPSGTVLQYKRQVGASADFDVTGTTYLDTGFSVALPNALAAAGNKVRIRVQFAIEFFYDPPLHVFSFTLKRGSTDLTPAQGAMVVVKEGATAADQILWITFEWEDAPGAVGVNTYKLFGKCDGGQKVTIVGTQAPVVMIAEEIKA